MLVCLAGVKSTGTSTLLVAGQNPLVHQGGVQLKWTDPIKSPAREPVK